MMTITASPKEFSERGVAAAEQGEYTMDNCSIHKMEEIEEAI